MGISEVWVPAGKEEWYIRHLLANVDDPYAVTTSHGPIGVVFYAPDEAVDALNAAITAEQDPPAWGNGAPASVVRTDDDSIGYSQDVTNAAPPKRKGRPPGVKNKTTSAE